MKEISESRFKIAIEFYEYGDLFYGDLVIDFAHDGEDYEILDVELDGTFGNGYPRSGIDPIKVDLKRFAKLLLEHEKEVLRDEARD